MEQKTELPEDLCADEAVCFIAYRHHVTPQQLLRHFLYGEASIPLEDNEVEILKGLLETSAKLSKKEIWCIAEKLVALRHETRKDIPVELKA